MNISCAGQKVCSVKGVVLATGFTPREILGDDLARLSALPENMDSGTDNPGLDDEQVDGFTTVVLMLAVTGLILSFFSRRRAQVATFTVGVVSIVAVLADFIYILDQSRPPLSAELGIGYILFLIALLVATAAAYLVAFRSGPPSRGSSLQ